MTHERVSLDAVDFTGALEYDKVVRVHARPAKPGERLLTVLSDGTVETSRVLDGTEWVVTNPGGEEYAMGAVKFFDRYYALEGTVSGEAGQYMSKGRILAVQNPWGVPIVVTAPWGEDQFGDTDCVIALNPNNERYIIGGTEFKDTYRVRTS